MNRREFTKGLAAAGLVPALPIGAASKAATAVAADNGLYIWADFIARVHNKCSPSMLSRLLHVDAEKGAALYKSLLSNGAITAPDAYGISKAVAPIHQQFASVAGHGSKIAATGTQDTNRILKKASQNFTEDVQETPMAEDVIEDADEAPAPDSGEFTGS